MSIGAELAAARRQAGLTVTEVSQRTRIRQAIVQGIERDDFSACGGDFYARGHIRAIGRVAGIDPEPLVREYDEAREAATQEMTIPIGRASRPAPAVPGPPAPTSRPAVAGQQEPAGKPEATGKKAAPVGALVQGDPAVADKPAATGKPAGPAKTALPRRPVPAAEAGMAEADMAAAGRAASSKAATLPAKLIIPAPGGPDAGPGRPAPPSLPPPPGGLRLPLWGTALVALLATTAGVLIYHAVSGHPSSHLTGSPAVAASRPAATPKVSQPTAAPTPTPSPTPSPSPTPNTVVISLDAVSEPCWAQITTADGTTLYEGIVSTGTTMTWTEGQAVTLSVGNPSAVTLTVNGKPQTGLGVNPVTLNLAPGGQ
jgi:cytoskeleton protein RodZ